VRVGVISQEVYPLLYGGIGVQMYLLAEHLAEAGHEVEFFTRMPKGNHPAAQGAVPSGMRLHFVDAEQGDGPGYLPAMAYARAVDVAVRGFHQHSPLELLIAIDFCGESFFLQLAPLERGDGRAVPTIMTLHGASRDVNRANSRPLTLDDEIISLQEEISIIASTMCLAPSRVYWEQLQSRLPLGDMPARIVPNFFNRAVFLREGRQDESAAAVEGAPKKIVFVGRLEYRKGIDLLVEAFARLSASRSDVELHIVGRDLEWKEYNGSFAAYWQNALPVDLRQKVCFHGHASPEQVNQVLESAYVAVFPSRWEPFGIVALEAMAAGVPVVVTADTGLAEIVGAGYELLAELDSGVNGLVRVLGMVLDDVALRSRVSQRAQARAEELWGNAHTGILSALSEIAAGKPLSRCQLPGPLIGKLQMLVWEHGAKTAEARHKEATALAGEVEFRDKLLLAEEEKILQRDDEIRKRDERIAAQQEEIHQLMQRLGKRR